MTVIYNTQAELLFIQFMLCVGHLRWCADRNAREGSFCVVADSKEQQGSKGYGVLQHEPAVSFNHDASTEIYTTQYTLSLHDERVKV